MGWPQRGVYFFFEDGEVREDGVSPRVVRVGTHALRPSWSGLWRRLAHHQGSVGGALAGGGSHRASIFRRHVGTALLAAGEWPGAVRESWLGGGSANAELRRQEHALEVAVSRHIGAMPFLWVEVDDPPSAASERGVIEAGAIALLSNLERPAIDPAAAGWLWPAGLSPRGSGVGSVERRPCGEVGWAGVPGCFGEVGADLACPCLSGPWAAMEAALAVLSHAVFNGAKELPKSGIIVPEMGSTRSRAHAGVADALFTPVQQRVLGLLFGQPDRRYQSAEIIRLARGGVGAVHRQLSRLASSGLVTVTQVGNQKHYQARVDSPIFHDLHGLVVKTVGVVEPLRKALGSLAKDILAAFVYGSVAKGSDKATSDVDLLVISDTVTYADAYEALQEAEAVLGRTINPNVMTGAQWQSRRSRSGSFAARVAGQRRLFVLGSDDDIA